jgi:hypothetical protein
MAPKFKRRIRELKPRRRLAFPRKLRPAQELNGLTSAELQGLWPTAAWFNVPPVSESGRGLNPS